MLKSALVTLICTARLQCFMNTLLIDTLFLYLMISSERWWLHINAQQPSLFVLFSEDFVHIHVHVNNLFNNSFLYVSLVCFPCCIDHQHIKRIS